MEDFKLFEVSWEVCNKVGGIYTVVKSKAAVISEHLKSNYILIGPYFPNRNNDFTEVVPPPKIRDIFSELKKQNILCHYGYWEIPGRPRVILIYPYQSSTSPNEVKTLFWEKFRIDSLNTNYYDYDLPILWGYSVGKFIEVFQQYYNDKNIVAHCHEWLSGGALLYIKAQNLNVKTVFTTHATTLGRTLAGQDYDLYHNIESIKADETAYHYGVQAKHLTEKQCALNADVFTTVSEITNIEAKQFLGREADILLPNGLDTSRFPTFEDGSIQHRQFKNRMKEFCLYFFKPFYDFDIENTLFFFTASRYEFHGKGIDTLIEALSMLDKKLRAEKSKKTIVTFFFIPLNNQGIHLDLLESKGFFEDIQETLSLNETQIFSRIVDSLIAKGKFNEKSIFTKAQLSELKRKTRALKRQGEPFLSTHIVDENNLIIKSFKEKKLLNLKENRVKVVLYPIYLTGSDSLLDLNYYEALLGSHLGVFPSFYEPWGYTPLETMSHGVVALTTDLSGFGRYLSSSYSKDELKGVYIVKRLGLNDSEFSLKLMKALYDFAKKSKRERIEKKIAASKLSEDFSWKILINNYIKAYELALKKWK